jgi:hypothetical protein
MLLEELRPQIRYDRSAEILYHREKGFPEDVRLPRGFSPVIRLRYGSHARQESLADRYGNIKLPETIDVRKGDIFEIGVIGNVVSKMAVRFPYNDKLDMVLVIQPSDGFVRTVWANEKGDTHKTLNLSKYADPKKQGR